MLAKPIHLGSNAAGGGGRPGSQEAPLWEVSNVQKQIQSSKKNAHWTDGLQASLVILRKEETAFSV